MRVLRQNYIRHPPRDGGAGMTRAVIITVALIFALNLMPREWGYAAGKWTRAVIGLPPMEGRDG